LALFVAGVGAGNVDHAAAADYFTLNAAFFHAGFDFHTIVTPGEPNDSPNSWWQAII
jgi:hypothetical protein